MTDFSDNVAAFATTPETYARVQANIYRTIQELRTESVKFATAFLLLDYPEAAVDIMADCLTRQLALVKIRHLEVVR